MTTSNDNTSTYAQMNFKVGDKEVSIPVTHAGFNTLQPVKRQNEREFAEMVEALNNAPRSITVTIPMKLDPAFVEEVKQLQERPEVIESTVVRMREEVDDLLAGFFGVSRHFYRSVTAREARDAFQSRAGASKSRSKKK